MSPLVKKYVKIALTVLVLGLGAYFRVDLSNFLPKTDTALEQTVVPAPSPDAGL